MKKSQPAGEKKRKEAIEKPVNLMEPKKVLTRRRI